MIPVHKLVRRYGAQVAVNERSVDDEPPDGLDASAAVGFKPYMAVG